MRSLVRRTTGSLPASVGVAAAAVQRPVLMTTSASALLAEDNRSVFLRTRGLDENCERLVSEKEQLDALAVELAGKIRYFDELDRLAAQLASPATAVDAGQLAGLFDRMDECLGFLAQHPHYLGEQGLGVMGLLTRLSTFMLRRMRPRLLSRAVPGSLLR